MPQGLEDVSKVPKLVAELLRRGWADADVKAALGENLLRVFRKAEDVSWTLTTQVFGGSCKTCFFWAQEARWAQKLSKASESPLTGPTRKSLHAELTLPR